MTKARWWLAPFAAALVIAGFGWFSVSRRPAETPIQAAKISSRFAGLDQQRALAEIDAEIANLNARIATPYGDIIDRETLSIAFIKRSKLTGDFADLVRSNAAVDEGIALSPPGTGPWLARAAAAFTVHRIDDAAAALDRVDKFVVPDSATRAEAAAMRGDIAMARGDYAGAARGYAAAGTIERWPGLPFREAVLARFMSDYDKARALFAEADALDRDPTPLFRADMLVRQGELDLVQGRFDGAADYFAKAAKTFPGYWRADMRVAQMDAIAGRTTPAIAAFARIADATDTPEAMDILAGLYRAQGDAAASRAWADRAGAVWRTRLKQLPEAAWAHAADHELAFGSPRVALGLAGRNARNRPDGAALILLARAWIANGRADYARALCLKVQRSGWVSPELHLVHAEALTLLGRGDEAEEAREAALAINPRALDRNPALAWLDH